MRCERDSSGTTEAAKGGEGDGADSPTRAGAQLPRSGSPKFYAINNWQSIFYQNLAISKKWVEKVKQSSVSKKF
jgi:hypothetical protein